MGIIAKTPGGEVVYYIPVLHVRDYTMDVIFEKKLYFLIPFYIFNIENELSYIDVSTERLDALKEFYADIVRKLERLVLTGRLTDFSYLELRDMTNRVVQNLAKKYGNIRKGIGDIMGGKVLVTEVSRARNKGREEEAVNIVKTMLRKGKTPEEIAELCD